MFALNIVSLIASAVASTAAPTLKSSSGNDPTTQNILDLGWSPGKAESSTSCLATYDTHICPAPLLNGNILVTCRHQVIHSAPALADRANSVQPSNNNTFIAGYTVIGEEIRTLSLFPDFPEGPDGARCRFHFITDSLSYMQTPDVIAAWDVYQVMPKFASWENLYNETSWNNAPPMTSDAPIASFVTPSSKDYFDGTPQAEKTVVYGDSGKIGMPFIDGGEDFVCPTASEDAAYMVVPRKLLVEPIEKPQVGDEPFTMSITGQNGLAIEILGTRMRV
ncbi:hypothetical protein EDC01DRAFT_671011 [Geopyxis carbonaria]|nr:hypothetical protein EDC01DRAFT_671011 [Geopyxis carbonaria]